MRIDYPCGKLKNGNAVKSSEAIHHFPFSKPMSEIWQQLTARQQCCRTFENGYCCWLACDKVMKYNIRKRAEQQKILQKIFNLQGSYIQRPLATLNDYNVVLTNKATFPNSSFWLQKYRLARKTDRVFSLTST